MPARTAPVSAGSGGRSDVRRMPAAERREAIVLAAREVFCAAGLRGGRMRAIAERAGVTEPLLYRHFASREELYRVAVEDHLTALLDDAVAGAERIVAAPGDDRSARVTALIRVYLSVMADIAPLASVALYEEHDRGKRFYQAVVRPRLREAAGVLYRTSTGRDMPEATAAVLTVSMFGPAFGVALDAMLRGRPVEVEAMADRIAMLFRGR